MKQPEKQLLIIYILLFFSSCFISLTAFFSPGFGISPTTGLILNPLLLLITASIASISFSRRIRQEKKNRIVLEQAIQGRYPGKNDGLSAELDELLTLIKEENIRFRRILSDHGETAEQIGMNLEQAIRLIDRMTVFISDVDKISSQIIHLYHRLENALIQTSNPDNLSETILKIRFELDHFSEGPTNMLNLLKNVYNRFRNNRQNLMKTQEGFLGTQAVATEAELDNISKQLEKLKELEEAIQLLEQHLESARFAVKENENTLRKLAEKFPELSGNLNETKELANRLPVRIHTLSGLITELEDVHEKGKLLALNAAIYAGEAGEEGRGFSTIAREMKSITESAEILQGRLQDELSELEKTTILTIEEMEKTQATEITMESFCRDALENSTAQLPELKSIQENHEQVSTVRQQLGELLNNREESAREKQKNLGKALADIRKSQQTSEEERELKFQIDNMVVESARFSEKLESELPSLLNAVGGILDEVSAFQDQLLQTRNTLADFADPRITESLKELKKAVEGNEIQLLRSSGKLLRKLKTKIPY